MSTYADVIKELQVIQDRIRSIREKTCDPKTKDNPRYHGLSLAVSGISKAIGSMSADDK